MMKKRQQILITSVKMKYQHDDDDDSDDHHHHDVDSDVADDSDNVDAKGSHPSKNTGIL